MIEAIGVFPISRIMAGAALFPFVLAFEKVDVLFHMALIAGIDETKITGLVAADRLFHALVGVTLRAFGFRVRAVQFKAGFLVIESFGIDGETIEGSTFVIGMAFHAGLALHEAVKVNFLLDVRANFLMAIRAQLVRNTPSRFVTFKAVFVLEIFVPNNQRTGRQKLIEQAFKARLRFLPHRTRGQKPKA